MRKCRLPKIQKSTNIETPLPTKSIDFSSPFSALLKQYKLKEKKSKMNYSTNKTNVNYVLTEPNSKRTLDLSETNLMKKEEDKILIEGQKYLIKLYESNHSSLIDKIKKESTIKVNLLKN